MDIVERLRSPEVFLTDGLISPVAETAAQEIERLRDELDTWMSVFPDIAPESVLPDRSNLEKEIERLREALKEIVKRDAGVIDILLGLKAEDSYC